MKKALGNQIFSSFLDVFHMISTFKNYGYILRIVYYLIDTFILSISKSKYEDY